MDVTSTRITRFEDSSSMPTLTHLDLECVALGTQYITVPIHIIIQKGIGIISTVITSIVTGHKSVSMILWKLK